MFIQDTYFASIQVVEQEYKEQRRAKGTIQGWFTKWEIGKFEAFLPGMPLEEQDAFLEDICSELGSRPNEKLSYRKRNVFQYWFSKEVQEKTLDERVHRVVWNKSMDVRPEEIEAQRGLIIAELNNSYDVAGGSSAAPKPGAQTSKRGVEAKALEREEKLSKLSAHERIEFDMSEEYTSFITRTKKAIADTSKLELSSGRTKIRWATLSKKNKWLFERRLTAAQSCVSKLCKQADDLNCLLTEIEGLEGADRRSVRKPRYQAATKVLQEKIESFKSQEFADVNKAMGTVDK